jgi:hypothetical protein
LDLSIAYLTLTGGHEILAEFLIANDRVD